MYTFTLVEMLCRPILVAVLWEVLYEAYSTRMYTILIIKVLKLDTVLSEDSQETLEHGPFSSLCKRARIVEFDSAGILNLRFGRDLREGSPI